MKQFLVFGRCLKKSFPVHADPLFIALIPQPFHIALHQRIGCVVIFALFHQTLVDAHGRLPLLEAIVPVLLQPLKVSCLGDQVMLKPTAPSTPPLFARYDPDRRKHEPMRADDPHIDSAEPFERIRILPHMLKIEDGEAAAGFQHAHHLA